MAVKWTQEQQQVIDLRDANILVSAAAGSGKTAVLVQRIIEKILDVDHPVNIDQFVIVTFTRAAAGEMRDRIQAAIEKEAALQPENAHLQRQRTRIHMANITTIHGFCTGIIKNHFQEIDLDPAFRVGDEGEFKLMRKDVLAQVLEEYYEEGQEGFLRFAETFSSGKTDEKMEDIILDLYRFAMSFPYPEKWLSQCMEYYQADSYETLVESPWIKSLMEHLVRMTETLPEKVSKLQELVWDNPLTFAYKDIVTFYKKKVQALQSGNDYDTWYQQLHGLEQPKLPVGKSSCPDKELREEINSVRGAIKKIFDEIAEGYFEQSSEQILDDLANCRPVMEMLVQITVSFMERYIEEKRQKNLLDYNDLEQEALHILRDADGNPTKTAKEYAEFFEEILIDEYQDSNLIQEYLLSAVSRLPFGGNNLFMVGDAKQSIYRFRLARPELFMEKFNQYSTTEGVCRRIDLHKNFRSRREVLDSANYIFGRIMKEELGEIEYNEDAALYHGMEFPAPVGEKDYTTELMLFDKRDLDLDAKEFEAKMIAHRIKKLVSEEGGLSVVDKKTGLYRRARYSDIAILLRSAKGFDSILVEELAAEGIPAHMLSREGYFDALEIVTMLNYLRIIDNPYQDIPLLSVLKSPIVSVTDDELATIRIFHGEEDLFTCVCAYGAEGEDEGLKNKLCQFLEQLEQFRQKMYYMPVHSFICHILDVTGYGDYIGVMPGGSQRSANMNMLVEKAYAFEQTSYTGVFQFVRYIEQLQKYEVEMGEASLLSENDDTVRIMTIHKSKGLEFPIVFVAGLGKRFNRMEEANPLAMHATMGVGMDNVFLEERVKSKTLLKKSVILRNRLESMGEELRVLYVALTRAKEKLILTGGLEHLPNSIVRAYEEGYGSQLSYASLAAAGTYFGWILAALACHDDMRYLIGEYIEEPGVSVREAFFEQAAFSIKVIELQDIMQEDLEELAKEARQELTMDMENAMSKRELPENIKQALEYVYPYDSKNAVPAKVSVSELKHAGMKLDEEERQLIETKETEPVIPSFLQEKKEKILGSDRGTAYHTVFEKLDLTMTDTIEQIHDQLNHMFESGFLEDSMRKVIRPEKLLAFAVSPIGKRMKKAQVEGRLYKEQPFVFALPAKQLKEEWNTGEPVMIQGIIDVYFEEEGELVLLDYKTDYIKSGKASELTDKYETQLRYYKIALEALTGKKVKESVLYSVYLEQEIFL